MVEEREGLCDFCDDKAEYLDVQFYVDDGEGGITIESQMNFCEKHYEERQKSNGWPYKIGRHI